MRELEYLIKAIWEENKKCDAQSSKLNEQRGNTVAHTLRFYQNQHGTNVVDITEAHRNDRDQVNAEKTTWFVMYKDNLTIILEDVGGDRRVYKVREWVRSDQCRATRLE